MGYWPVLALFGVVALGWLLRAFKARKEVRTTMPDDSMVRTLQPGQEVVVVFGKQHQAGNIVAYRRPAVPLAISRVVATAGDPVPAEMWEAVDLDTVVPEGFVLVRNDNLQNDADSRTFGYLPTDAVVGVVWLPANDWVTEQR